MYVKVALGVGAAAAAANVNYENGCRMQILQGSRRSLCVLCICTRLRDPDSINWVTVLFRNHPLNQK